MSRVELSRDAGTESLSRIDKPRDTEAKILSRVDKSRDAGTGMIMPDNTGEVKELMSAAEDQVYLLKEIEELLHREAFPLQGVTRLGSARFLFRAPAGPAGIALHTGRRIREELHSILEVSDTDRFREEDPGTERLIETLPIQIIAQDSRFEYDLNRAIERTIPLTPETAWGLKVWKRPLTDAEKETSLAKYREFHRLMEIVSDFMVSRGRPAYIFDLHSYCYQKNGNQPWHQDPQPDLNLGTMSINQCRFRKAIDTLLSELRMITIEGRKIRVAENELFLGGHLARKLCARHHSQLAVFAVEFKKLYMDEWSGEFNQDNFAELTSNFYRVLDNFITAVRDD